MARPKSTMSLAFPMTTWRVPMRALTPWPVTERKSWRPEEPGRAREPRQQSRQLADVRSIAQRWPRV